jgi:hypothetical protein
MKNTIIILLLVFTVVSCNKLEQIPQSTVSKEAVFNTESGLKLYSNSFYTILPTSNDVLKGDNLADFVARKDVPDFFRPGAFGPRQSSGWTWGDLRNINYFLENNHSPALSAEVRNNYNGIARFFRALFYFEKVKRFGDVPWVNKTLDVNDEVLYQGRDARTLVMDSVLSDLNYAIENIKATNENTRSRITKDVALAFKSRICLFEGTFRKYHTSLNLQGSASAWLEEAAKAAKAVIDAGQFRLNTSSDQDHDYQNLFISSSVNPEFILSIAYSEELGVFHDANWYYTSSTYGDRLSFTRNFINTYLNLDGTAFTSDPNFYTVPFAEEVKNRDKRLKQTIRTKGYTRINGGQQVVAPPLFSQTYTGYQPLKWVNADMSLDGGSRSSSLIPIFRYAEVLLNFAEAKAELGTITDEDWAASIGLLRKRAGITNGLNNKPVLVDSYLQSTFYPNISDPVILEVRRERGIELALEGFRFYDVIRWKLGELFTKKWNGMYVAQLNTPIDLNEDGVPDVAFVNGNPASPVAGVLYMNVAPNIGGQVNAMQLSEGNKGEIVWLNNISRVWSDRMYLYPIPENDLLMNPKLGQNPNW